MRNVLLLIFSLYLVGCGSSSGGNGAPAFVGSYQSACVASGGDSSYATLVITAATVTYSGVSFTGSTTCAGSGTDDTPTTESYTVAQSSSNTFLLRFSGGDQLIKVIPGGLVIDSGAAAPFEEDWDYVSEGSYLEYSKQ